MENLKNNKILGILVVVTIFNIGAFIIGHIIVEKTTERVLQRLKKEYSPSPYGPGYDPDKLRPEIFNSPKLNSKTKVMFDEKLRQSKEEMTKVISDSEEWRDNWENSRSTSREQ